MLNYSELTKPDCIEDLIQIITKPEEEQQKTTNKALQISTPVDITMSSDFTCVTLSADNSVHKYNEINLASYQSNKDMMIEKIHSREVLQDIELWMNEHKYNTVGKPILETSP